jgi:hypothetical protein
MARRLAGSNHCVLNKWELGWRAANQLAELAIEMGLVGISGSVGHIGQRVPDAHPLSRVLHAEQAPDRLRR